MEKRNEYFPNIGKYIQEPNNLQSFNRYSYVWNNPLSKTDPSGFVTKGLDTELRGGDESVPGPVLQIGNTNSRYKFSIGAKAFMNDWSKGGPAHHCAIGTGHIASKIKKLAELLGIEFSKIC